MDRFLELRDLKRSFDGQEILRGVSLTVNQGEIVALLGPSGCGKTTLLRIIAGLEIADEGQIWLEGQDLTKIPVHKRRFGLVFQDYALFPHKSAAENIAFGLRMLGWGRSAQEKRVNQVLKLVGLSGFENRRVYDLSGGEQQRVALARSLAPSPKLVLLDEPLGALDRALREQLMGELRTILREAGTGLVDRRDSVDPGMELFSPSPENPAVSMTSIYVTHDQEEAFAIADRVFVMNAGQVEQQGTPVQLFRYPESRFVARFLGMDNLLEATLLPGYPARVRTEMGELQISSPATGASGPRTLLIRPGAGVFRQKGEIGDNFITGLLQDVSFRGRHQMVTLLVPTENRMKPLRLSFDSSVIFPAEHAEITLWLDPKELQLLSR